MKWNWGTGLVVGMLTFMSFILYLVISMSTNQKYSHDLVTPDYYAKEMAYQTEIDAETNNTKLVNKITGKQIPNGWEITFPKEFEDSKINGTVFLYRPSNQKLDFDFPINIINSKLIIPHSKMLEGRWNITIDWKHEGVSYLYKKEILY